MSVEPGFELNGGKERERQGKGVSLTDFEAVDLKERRMSMLTRLTARLRDSRSVLSSKIQLET